MVGAVWWSGSVYKRIKPTPFKYIEILGVAPNINQIINQGHTHVHGHGHVCRHVHVHVHRYPVPVTPNGISNHAVREVKRKEDESWCAS